MNDRNFVDSLNDAVEGILHALRHERNMRIHFLFAVFVLVLAAFIGVSRIEWIVLSLVVTLVLVAELLNTAVEEIVDLVQATYHPAARIIKHLSAGLVLVTAVNAMIAGFFIFSRYWAWPFEAATLSFKRAPGYLTFIALLGVVLTVVGSKAFLHSGTPFRGGAISGHAAVAFSLWAVIVHTSDDVLVKALALILAVLVARSRWKARIHTVWQALAGALVGALLTSLLFKIFG